MTEVAVLRLAHGADLPLPAYQTASAAGLDLMAAIDAPELPTDSEFIDSISRGGRLVAASALELTPEQLKALPIPAQAASQPAAAAPPPSPPRNYPPLEPS